MKHNDTDRKTSFWWVCALVLLACAVLWVHNDNRAGKNAPPTKNVHTTPTPQVAHHG